MDYILKWDYFGYIGLSKCTVKMNYTSLFYCFLKWLLENFIWLLWLILYFCCIALVRTIHHIILSLFVFFWSHPLDWELKEGMKSGFQCPKRGSIEGNLPQMLVKWMKVWPKTNTTIRYFWNNYKITWNYILWIAIELPADLFGVEMTFNTYGWYVCPVLPTGINEMNIPEQHWTLYMRLRLVHLSRRWAGMATNL